jgi:hypothetical protein
VGDARAGRPRDDGSRTQRVLGDPIALPQEQIAFSLEHDEDLLLGRVTVRGSVQLARKDLREAESRAERACRLSRVPNAAADG